MKFLPLVALAFVAVVAAEESQVLKSFAVGQTQFAANVYKELLKSNSGNFLVSPLSAHIILALVHEGAKGNTAQQLSATLHLPENNDEVHQIFRELTSYLNVTTGYTLTSANKVYLKSDFEIVDEFKNTASDVYGAEIQNIDFSNNEQAANEMNSWVEHKTHDKIKDLIDKSDLGASTVAVLINALYFKGKWVSKFMPCSPSKKAFHVNNKDEVLVDMMEQKTQLHYYESSELKARFLEIPYLGNQVTMTIVLPNDVEGLSALEDRLSDVLVTPEYKGKVTTEVVLPKFKTETTIQLKPILQSLGIVDAFENSADFSGMGAAQEHLKISKVVQKAFIKVTEKGTTAAAATAVFYGLTGMGSPRAAVHFIADHPFIYYLKSSAGILFVGRYIKP